MFESASHDTRYRAEKYAHQQAVLEAGMEALRLRSQRNAGWWIAGVLAIWAVLRSML